MVSWDFIMDLFCPNVDELIIEEPLQRQLQAPTTQLTTKGQYDKLRRNDLNSKERDPEDPQNVLIINSKAIEEEETGGLDPLSYVV